MHSNLVARQNGGLSYNGPNRGTEGQPTRCSTPRVAFTLPHRTQCGCSGIRFDSQRSGTEHGAGGGRARFPAIFDAAFRFAERAPRPSAARPPRSRSLVSKGKTHAHGHGPAAHSLARADVRLGSAGGSTAIALSSAPAAAIYCHTPTYLPSFLLPEAIPTIATNLSPR